MLMKVLYGTTNTAKLNSMRRITQHMDLELLGLNDLDQPPPDIIEGGKDPLENARIKAMAYYNAFSMPVFSCDSGLYFDGLDDALQPGTHIRRVGGKALTDEEMLTYYASLAADHGGMLKGRYRNAIYFILDETTHYFSMDDSLASAPFGLCARAHAKRVPGFPLDALSVDPATGTYYYDMDDAAADSLFTESGFKRFFSSIL